METNLTIKKIGNVFDGEFNPGILPAKKSGRHCDCFVYYVSGKAEYVFDGYSFDAMPQNFIYLSKNSIYTIKVSEKSRFICVDFDFDDVSGKRLSKEFECNLNFAKNQFQKMLYVWNEKKLSYIPQLFSYVYCIYSEAIKSENRLYAKKNLLISDIVSYISIHYCEEAFTVKKLSEHFGISEVHLRRIFQSTVYISPIKYINSLKIEKAKNMLRISNYTITEISRSIGFDDPYYFSRFFKKEIGISPSEYRKNVKQTL